MKRNSTKSQAIVLVVWFSAMCALASAAEKGIISDREKVSELPEPVSTVIETAAMNTVQYNRYGQAGAKVEVETVKYTVEVAKKMEVREVVRITFFNKEGFVGASISFKKNTVLTELGELAEKYSKGTPVISGTYTQEKDGTRFFVTNIVRLKKQG